MVRVHKDGISHLCRCRRLGEPSSFACLGAEYFESDGFILLQLLQVIVDIVPNDVR